MRTGIEKLQVRIESDERKKKKMGELLKGNLTSQKMTYAVVFVKCWSKCDCVSVAAQIKSDSLQDRIDALEREKEDYEQSLEEAVLQVFGCKLSKKQN